MNERGKTPMTKNVTVLSSEGNPIGATYPKRAQGLVKKGRARYLDGDETVIVLAASPDDITSQEDEMNNNFNFDEFIEKTKAAAKAAGETVYHVTETAADKAEDAFNRAIAHLNSAMTDYLAKKESESESIENELSELESDLGEIEAELSELEDTVNADESVRIREKIAALTAKMRAKTRDYETLRRGKEICKSAVNSASEAVKDAAKWASEAVKEAKQSVEARVEARQAEIHVGYDPEAERNRMIEKVLDRIYELRAMRTETEAYLDTIAEMSVGAPGEIGTQAKANAIVAIVSENAQQNRDILEVYTGMLETLYEERDQYNEEKQTREVGESNARDTRCKMFETTVEMITRADESTDVNVLAFYIRTAEKLAKESDVMTPDLASRLMSEMLTETDVNKLSCYMNLIDSMK